MDIHVLHTAALGWYHGVAAADCSLWIPKEHSALLSKLLNSCSLWSQSPNTAPPASCTPFIIYSSPLVYLTFNPSVCFHLEFHYATLLDLRQGTAGCVLSNVYKLSVRESSRTVSLDSNDENSPYLQFVLFFFVCKLSANQVVCLQTSSAVTFKSSVLGTFSHVCD